MKTAHALILAVPFALAACEEQSTSEKIESGATSTLGKVKQSADRTVDKIQAAQDKASKQADEIVGN
jgi:hypothetical protein